MGLPAALHGKLRVPVVAAPMFLVSGVELASASCDAGIVGTLPALNARTTEALDEWLSRMGSRFYGVNLIVHRSNPRLQQDLALLEKHRVPLVVTSLGAAPEVIAKVHGWGGLVFHDVTNAHHGKKAADAGADGIVAVAGGAGGHAGTINPFALVSELRTFFSGTLLLGGCINHGAQVLAAQAMGADLAWLGTRFIATEEAAADAAYKSMITSSSAADIVHTPAVSGVPASFLRASLERAGYDMKRLMTPGEIDYGQKLKPVDDEAKAWKTVWSAGQGVGTIRDVPSVRALVDRLAAEYEAARAALRG